MIPRLVLIYCCGCLIASAFIFLYGFFPVKVRTAAYASKAETNLKVSQLLESVHNRSELSACLNEHARLPRPAFSRLVFMVIDAWRADFLLTDAGSHMTWLRLALRNGTALGYRGRCQAPTVTMPRIKALTAGTVPAYVDVLLNLASPEIQEDNLLYQLHAAGRRLVFYGDDTWLKLFPSYFVRAEGVTSFYVNDYTEVDHNVTRHLEDELHNAENWDALFLHFLGLDHVGHLYGPYSNLVPQKLQEMDDVVKRIYETLAARGDSDFLMIIVGDHGMSETGSHGGASASETHVPLIFLSPKFPTSAHQIPISCVAQIDLIPTVSGLLGLPLPLASLGVAILEPLSAVYTSDEIAMLAYLNTQRLFDVAGKSAYKIPGIAEAVSSDLSMHAVYLQQLCEKKAGMKVQVWVGMLTGSYLSIMHRLQEGLISAFTEYNVYILVTAIGLAAHVVVILTYYVYQERGTEEGSTATVFAAGVFMHCVSLAASSLVEEEHYTWYFFWTTALCVLFHRRLTRFWRKRPWHADCGAVVALLVLTRLLTSWNRTGVKWSHLPDLADWLNSDAPGTFKVLLICACAVALVFLVDHRCSLTFSLALSSAMGYHLTNAFSLGLVPVWLARCTYGLTVLHGLVEVKWNGAGSVISVLILFGILLGRSHNIPVIVLSAAMVRLLSAVCDKLTLTRSFVLYYFAAFMFFAMGNSNSLGSVDISAGYVGLGDYRPALVGLLTVINMYAVPAVVLLSGRSSHLNSALLWCRAVPFTVCLALTFVQRYHLFVWSVFAPKLLYECMHTFLMCVSFTVVAVFGL